MNKKIYLLLLLFPFLSACEAFDRDNAYSSGDADFSKYVAIGNSLTSGFMNGDLYETAQWSSYPYVISTMMARANGGVFKQPLMTDDTGFGTRIVFDIDAQLPQLAGIAGSPENYENIANQGPFNNMGVPGAKVADLLATTEGLDSNNAESYYRRFAENYGAVSIMDEVMNQEPTFVTLWIGTNDALGYALRGGDISDDARQAITTPEEFRTQFQAVVDRLNGTPGIVANLPEISVIPYFDMGGIMETLLNLDLYDGLDLTPAEVELVNQKISEANCGSDIQFTTSNNGVLVEDPDEPCGFRMIKPTDQILLTLFAAHSSLTTEVKENGLGWADNDGLRPIPHEFILDEDERKQIEDAINAYNAIIADIVNNTQGLFLLDIAAEMLRLKDGGIPIGEAPTGFVFTTDYVQGSFFSWDGVHPTGEGYAYIANQFIKAINQNFNSNLPQKNIRANAAP